MALLPWHARKSWPYLPGVTHHLKRECKAYGWHRKVWRHPWPHLGKWAKGTYHSLRVHIIHARVHHGLSVHWCAHHLLEGVITRGLTGGYILGGAGRALVRLSWPGATTSAPWMPELYVLMNSETCWKGAEVSLSALSGSCTRIASRQFFRMFSCRICWKQSLGISLPKTDQINKLNLNTRRLNTFKALGVDVVAVIPT